MYENKQSCLKSFIPSETSVKCVSYKNTILKVPEMQNQGVITYKLLLLLCCCPHPSVALDGAISSCLSSVQAGRLRRVISAFASAVPLTWSHLINRFAVGYLSISQAAISISAVGEGALLPKVRICVKSLLRFGCLSLKPQLLELSLQENHLEG